MVLSPPTDTANTLLELRVRPTSSPPPTWRLAPTASRRDGELHLRGPHAPRRAALCDRARQLIRGGPTTQDHRVQLQRAQLRCAPSLHAASRGRGRRTLQHRAKGGDDALLRRHVLPGGGGGGPVIARGAGGCAPCRPTPPAPSLFSAAHRHDGTRPPGAAQQVVGKQPGQPSTALVHASSSASRVGRDDHELSRDQRGAHVLQMLQPLLGYIEYDVTLNAKSEGTAIKALPPMEFRLTYVPTDFTNTQVISANS